MTSLPVSVLVLGIGIVRNQSIGYWVLGAELGIVLTLIFIEHCHCLCSTNAYRVHTPAVHYFTLGSSCEVLWWVRLCVSVCVGIEGACLVPWVGAWEVPGAFGSYLREAFQSQTNTEKILYKESR